MISILSLDLADRCELQIGLLVGPSILVVLTDGTVKFKGEVGSIDPLWAVLNGAKAAARSNRTLLGLAREGSEIDVVAYERGIGVQLASRFSAAAFSDMLARVEADRVARRMEAPVPRFSSLSHYRR